MSDEQREYLTYQQAMQLVAAIQEEEDVEEVNRRILTVYGHDDNELCWFDFDETIKAVGAVAKGELKEAVQNYILHHIPAWVLED
ncbi:MAG: hypothetical protein ACK5PS_16395 [Desulfopila sp.]